MKLLYTPLALSVAFSVLTCVYSCSENVAETQSRYDYQRDDSLPADYVRELGNFRVGMELIAGMNESIMHEKNSYNSLLLNPASRTTTYNTSKTQAINLGIYVADLSFAAAFNQTQDVRKYSDAIFQLAEKLGIKSAFDKDMLEKLTSGDTTVNKAKLFSMAFRHLQENMHSNQRSYLMALMVAGGWIESVYLASSVLKTKPLSAEMNAIFFDNAYTYQNVKKILEVFHSDCKDCNDIFLELETVSAPIDKIIVNSRYGITQAQLEELYNPLSAIREKIVS